MDIKKRILSFLLKKNLNFWEMVPYLGRLSYTVKVLKELENQKLIKIFNSKISLTEEGRKKACSLKISPQELPQKINFFSFNPKLLLKFKKIRKEGFSKDEYDQLQLLPEAVLTKLEVLRFKGDLEGKKIICLGDDDMMALALALTRLPAEICVLDIDKEIIDYENKVFKKLKVKGRAYYHNLLLKIPSKFKQKYDVFITEPPDTPFGNSLFFSRGVECIKKEGGVGYLGITSTDLSKEEYLEIEKNILKMKGVITDIFSKLEAYKVDNEKEWVINLPEKLGWPKKPWYFADLLRVEILENPKPLFPYSFKKGVPKNLIRTYIYC